VDLVTIPSSRPGKPPLRRITEVFDCWFESGSMPYAQCHYPFENKREFEDSFPADFIAEGQDQTRGWFYTLLVISTALFDKPPFKNLIVNGLVLASDGQKMSKSKQNYPDPMLVVNKFGADAVRLYLINSPVVKAENLRFKEEGVQGILRDVFLPWYNAFRFLFQNIDTYEREHGIEFSWSEHAAAGRSTNVMDRWLVSFTQSLLLFLAQEMAAYRLYTVIPRLMKFIDNLTNWYVRMNRRRLKGEGGRSDCLAALNTLFGVVMTMVRVMAPFTPFLTEKMYQQLRRKVPELAGPDSASVHYLMLPTARQELIDEGIERAVGRMQAVVDLGRVLRDRKTMPIKYPLPEVVVIHKDQQALDDIRSLEQYIKEELNVRAVTLSADKASYGVTLRAEPDHKTLGLRLKGAFKPVMAEIKSLSDSVLTAFLAGAPLEVQGHRLERDDLRIMYQADAAGSEKYETDSCGDTLIMLDTSPDQAMLDEGVAREVVNRVQKLRKSTGLKVADRVTMFYTIQPAGHGLAKIMHEFGDYIQTASKTPLRPLPSPSPAGGLGHERYELKGAELTLTVVKGFPAGHSDGGSPSPGAVPAVPWCNVQLVGVSPAPHCGVSCHGGLILPISSNLSALLPGLVQHLFGLYGVPLDLFLDAACETRLGPTSSLDGKTLFVFKAGQGEGKVEGGGEGFNCKFVNVMTSGGVTHSVLLENPVGRSAVEELGEAMVGFGGRDGPFADKERKKRVQLADIEKHAGQMVYL
jgi:isoleucyl-tRNA synthetase